MAVAMQATQAPVVPVAPQGSSQAANPRPIAGIKTLICEMAKFTMETIQVRASPPSVTAVSPVVVSSVSVSVVSVVSVSVSVVLARAGGVSCRSSRPATRANMRSFCACMMTSMISLQIFLESLLVRAFSCKS